MTEKQAEIYKALTGSLHQIIKENDYSGPFDVYYNYSATFLWSLEDLRDVLSAWCESSSIPSVITVKKPRNGETLGVFEADVEKGFLKKVLCRRYFKVISGAIEKGYVDRVSKDELIKLIKEEGNAFNAIS